MHNGYIVIINVAFACSDNKGSPRASYQGKNLELVKEQVN